MQTENRLFDDLARLATGAVGSLSGVRQEVETRIREQVERLLSRLDLVTREEFDAVQAMAAKARLEQEQMGRRLAILEEKLGLTSTVAGGSPDPFADGPADQPVKSSAFIDGADVPPTSPGIV